MAVLLGLVGALATGIGHRIRSTVGAAVLAAALGLGVGFVGLSVALVATADIDGFGVVHWLYLCGVIAAPMTGVTIGAIAITTPPEPVIRRGRRLALLVAALLVLPVPVGAYATHVAPFRLTVDTATATVPDARSGNNEVVIAVLADLQTNTITGHERGAIDRVIAARPDIIVVPGDIFQGTARELERATPAIREQLARLRAPGGVYFVRGDVDSVEPVEALLTGLDITILDNQIITVAVGDRDLAIGGVDLMYDAETARVVYDDLLGRSGGEEITILLSHRPDAVLQLPDDAGIDLVISGHSHGGQIAIPGFGPLMTLSEVPRAVAAGGLHEVGGNPIYVSPGIGIERAQAPQIRLFTRPAVGVVTLRSGT